jgi:hypothetical protein
MTQHLLDRLARNGLSALCAVLDAALGKKQSKVIVYFGYRADR